MATERERLNAEPAEATEGLTPRDVSKPMPERATIPAPPTSGLWEGST